MPHLAHCNFKRSSRKKGNVDSWPVATPVVVHKGLNGPCGNKVVVSRRHGGKDSEFGREGRTFPGGGGS